MKIRKSLIAVALLVSVFGAQAAKKPNVVVFFVDDMGYGELGCYGSRDLRTPHIDSLAKGGTRFTRFYATGVTCQPSRTGFMTSCYPFSFEKRIGNGDFSPEGRLLFLRLHPYSTAVSVGRSGLHRNPRETGIELSV